jgi:predicted DNA-binding antitoxin AbrB/MazE fold protein
MRFAGGLSDGSLARYNQAEIDMATVKVIYEHGVFKPTEPVSLPEHAEAEVVIPSSVSAEDDPTGWKAMREFIGLGGENADSGNASENHDAIIYRRR